MQLLFAITIILLLSGCYQNESSLTDTLVYCSEKAPRTFNPQINNDLATLDATTHQLYNRIVKLDPQSKQVVADLATHWISREDKLSYTFFLRKNVTFHSTDYFTPTHFFSADDVIFSFQRMIKKDHPFHFVNSADDSYFFNHPFKNVVADIIKIDDYTVEFILHKPITTFLANLTAHYAIIHSSEYAQQLISTGHPEKFDFFPIGTGPYQFKNSTITGITRYLSHPKYWGDVPSINNLIYDATANNNKRYTKLLSGECDIMTDPAPSQVAKISQNPNVTVNIEPTANLALWSFNSVKPPFNHREIRQALSYAIDQKTIVDAVFFQSGAAANTLLAKQSWAYNPSAKQLQYKPQLAQKMLEKMQEENGFDFNKKITILTPVDNSALNPNFHKTAELIQINLKDIGIDSEIIFLDKFALEKRLASGNYDTYLTGININIDDPDSLFRPLLSCDVTIMQGNTSQWCSQKVQDLLDATLLEPNKKQRMQNYYRLQETLAFESPYYPIAHLFRIDVFKKNLSDLLIDPFTGINFQNIKKIEAQ